jgi:hypothetical protein
VENFGLPEVRILDEDRFAPPLKVIFAGLVASAFIFGSVGPPVADAKTVKTVKKSLTEAQKAELRKRGREWCMKKHIHSGTSIAKVEVRSDGRVICYVRE